MVFGLAQGWLFELLLIDVVTSSDTAVMIDCLDVLSAKRIAWSSDLVILQGARVVRGVSQTRRASPQPSQRVSKFAKNDQARKRDSFLRLEDSYDMCSIHRCRQSDRAAHTNMSVIPTSTISAFYPRIGTLCQ